MRVLLVSANREEINMLTWPLGLACVAEATRRAGHGVLMLDLIRTSEPLAKVEKAITSFGPDVIGISVRNIDNQSLSDTKVFLAEVREVVLKCKSATKAPVVLGGAGYSMYPESLLEDLHADMGIQGEGEVAFTALLAALESSTDLGSVPGLYVAGSGMQAQRVFMNDLDQLPLPDTNKFRRDIPKDTEFWLPVQTRRGCPMNCSYCSTAAIEGCRLRKRSPEIVVAWLREWVRIGLKRFHFVDNTFNIPERYAKKLCASLISANLSAAWRCIVYPLRLDTELAGLMARSGCYEVAVGFESGSELVLHGMNKKFKPDDVRNVCRVLGEYGIRRMGFLMLGGPGETRETALTSLRFADSLELEMVKVTAGIRIYPHTRLADVAVNEGLIDPRDDLLSPRFYVAPGLGDWLQETAQAWMAERPNWVS